MDNVTIRLTGFLTQPEVAGGNAIVGMSVRDLSLRPDCIYALIGASGSGKSLFLSLLAGFPLFAWRKMSFWSHWESFGVKVRPGKKGKVIPSPAFPIDSHHALIYLPQTFPQDRSESLRTIDAMAFFLCAGCKGINLEAARHRLREVVCAEPYCLAPEVFDQPLHQLSGGERRRVELATRLEAVKIRGQGTRTGGSMILLLLDEPTAGLDPVKELEFIRFLGGLRASSREAGLGMTIVVATHAFTLLSPGAAHFDEVLVLAKDHAQPSRSSFIRLVFQGSIARAFQHFARTSHAAGTISGWTDVLRQLNDGPSVRWEEAFFGGSSR